MILQLLLLYLYAPTALHSSAQPWLQLAKIFIIFINSSKWPKQNHNSSMYPLCKMINQEISISFTHLLMLDNSKFSQRLKFILKEESLTLYTPITKLHKHAKLIHHIKTWLLFFTVDISLKLTWLSRFTSANLTLWASTIMDIRQFAIRMAKFNVMELVPVLAFTVLNTVLLLVVILILETQALASCFPLQWDHIKLPQLWFSV